MTGVGNVQVFGAQYAMRIWMDPYKLHDFGLMPSDIANSIKAQNTQVSAGAIGAQPAAPGQELNATVTAQSQLQTPEQFRDIIVKTSTSGAVVRLRDVARVELGAENYSIKSLFNGKPASGAAIMLAPGANALKTVDAVKARAESLRGSLPPGMKLSYPIDNTTFIRLSIHQVVVTLIEAIALVVLVMFVFLQNWRTTLVPAVAVPVVLLGTFGILAGFGYTINTLTLFALVLVIGLLVDDAIVVVENVERIMREERLPPREATLRSMTEITGALIGIGLVLTAVFLPDGLFRRLDRGDLPPILGHHRFGHAAFDHVRPGADSGALRHPARNPIPTMMPGPRDCWAASSPGSTATSSACAKPIAGASAGR